jgi:hypothetical protein
MLSTHSLAADLWSELEGPSQALDHLSFVGKGTLSSSFAVSDFAAATTSVAALALAEWVSLLDHPFPGLSVDRRLSDLWFSKSLRPIGWPLPPQWDPIAGNYRTIDGWIRLHTNASHHRAALLKVLGCTADAKSVGDCVAKWTGQALEDAVIEQGGCAARMLSRDKWLAHAQGRAVEKELLIARQNHKNFSLRVLGSPSRPLQGLRVLDLTRVLAGPVGTRFLAGFGANVLRIDSPLWDEPAVLPEVSIGKRRARLNLEDKSDRRIFEGLLSQADVLVHGYRSDALENLGFGFLTRQDINPFLIDVALDAYGWTGPWAHRRGFDTIVQMSTGLAHSEALSSGSDAPKLLPVQALDYGTGYLMAAAVLRLLSSARQGMGAGSARLSLARTAGFLAKYRQPEICDDLACCEQDFDESIEQTFWGPAQRLRKPFLMDGISMSWDRPAGPVGDSAACFD